jgi:two-component system OmpR family response regulator
MHFLLVEDDPEVARFVIKGLGEAGHLVDHAPDGREGLYKATGGGFDALIVDRMLPGGIDGLTLIETLRRSGSTTPVLILSAMAQVDDRVRGLKAGGDDYLTKPFAFAELQARLEAILRRGSVKTVETVLRVADLELDLLPRELRLLEYLMRHVGQVVTRTMLLESVWDYHFDPQTNVIDVHVSRLRQKIDKGFARPLIHTIRGAGYSLRPEP